MSSNSTKYEVLIKQYLRSILDISADFRISNPCSDGAAWSQPVGASHSSDYFRKFTLANGTAFSRMPVKRTISRGKPKI